MSAPLELYPDNRIQALIRAVDILLSPWAHIYAHPAQCRINACLCRPFPGGLPAVMGLVQLVTVLVDRPQFTGYSLAKACIRASVTFPAYP